MFTLSYFTLLHLGYSTLFISALVNALLSLHDMHEFCCSKFGFCHLRMGMEDQKLKYDLQWHPCMHLTLEIAEANSRSTINHEYHVMSHMLYIAVAKAANRSIQATLQYEITYCN